MTGGKKERIVLKSLVIFTMFTYFLKLKLKLKVYKSTCFYFINTQFTSYLPYLSGCVVWLSLAHHYVLIKAQRAEIELGLRLMLGWGGALHRHEGEWMDNGDGLDSIVESICKYVMLTNQQAVSSKLFSFGCQFRIVKLNCGFKIFDNG